MTDGVECPTCGRDDFESTRGMRSHHALTHGKSLLAGRSCDYCGESFHADHNGQQYCSKQCYQDDRSQRLTKTCPICGDTFDTAPSDDTTYCSTECAGESRAVAVTSTCEYCGDSFTHKPWDERRFCSRDCSQSHHQETLGDQERFDCQQCGRTFSTAPSDDPSYCCSGCFLEARCERPRPDKSRMLCWLLYEYEGHNVCETFQRQRAHYGHDDALTLEEVRDILDQLGIKREVGGESKRVRDLRQLDAEDVLGETPDGEDTWRQHSTGGGQA